MPRVAWSTASFHLLGLVDNYGIIAYACGLLEYGKRTKVKILVGLETSPVARVELPKLTFDGRSNAEFNAELAVAHASFTGQKSYPSAIHAVGWGQCVSGGVTVQIEQFGSGLFAYHQV